MQKKRTSGNLVVLAIVAFGLSLSAHSLAAQKTAKGKTKIVTKKAVAVTELRNIEQLKEAFQRDVGKIRLVTILSPT
jgi:hypothetical protein